MKLKGINPFERHVEKAVLALFALFALGVLVMQLGLLGGRNEIKVGSASVAPELALTEVSKRAAAKNAGLSSPTKPDAIPDPASLPSLKEQFTEALAAPVGGGARLASLGVPDVASETTWSPGTVTDPGAGDGQFAAVVPPAASRPLAMVVEGTFDPAAVMSAGPELQRLLPPAQPYDKRAISVQATIDTAAIRKRLQREGDGVSAIPAGWWQGTAEILDVELVRQEQQPDGSWGAETVVAAPPGSVGAELRAKLNSESITPAIRRELLQREALARESVRRPAYFPMIAGVRWRAPSLAAEATAANPNQATIDRLVGQLEGKRAEIKRVKGRLEPKPVEERTPPPGQRPGGGERGGFASASFSSSGGVAASPAGGGGGRKPQPRQKSPEEIDRERKEQTKKNLEEQLKKLEEEEKKLVADLKKLGHDPDAKPMGDAPAPVFTEPTLAVSDQTAAAVTVWSHDLTAQPGKTYRYQVRYWLGNPYYGNVDRLPEAQRDLAAAPALRSEASEWSEPATLEPDQVYFVTSASPVSYGALKGEAAATVEMFRFVYGYWRRATESLQLGDALHAAIELPAGFEIFEIGAPAAAERSPLPDEMKRVSIAGFLLDVAADPGTQTGARAYFGDASGSIAVRRPEDDRNMSVYARLSASSAAGETATTRAPGSAGTPTATPTDSGRETPSNPENPEAPRREQPGSDAPARGRDG